MKTIEERGKEFRDSKEKEYGVTDLNGMEIGYVAGATEQDRIARAECIEAAQEWLMEYLGDTDRDNPIVESLVRAIMKGCDGANDKNCMSCKHRIVINGFPSQTIACWEVADNEGADHRAVIKDGRNYVCEYHKAIEKGGEK